jgi:lipoate-protein ligase A
MKTAEEIMNKHFKECFEIHKEKISEKYIFYFHKAMKEYAQQESEREVKKFKNELLKEIDSWNKYLLDKIVISIVKTDYLIEKLK